MSVLYNWIKVGLPDISGIDIYLQSLGDELKLAKGDFQDAITQLEEVKKYFDEGACIMEYENYDKGKVAEKLELLKELKESLNQLDNNISACKNFFK